MSPGAFWVRGVSEEAGETDSFLPSVAWIPVLWDEKKAFEFSENREPTRSHPFPSLETWKSEKTVKIQKWRWALLSLLTLLLSGLPEFFKKANLEQKVNVLQTLTPERSVSKGADEAGCAAFLSSTDRWLRSLWDLESNLEGESLSLLEFDWRQGLSLQGVSRKPVMEWMERLEKNSGFDRVILKSQKNSLKIPGVEFQMRGEWENSGENVHG